MNTCHSKTCLHKQLVCVTCLYKKTGGPSVVSNEAAVNHPAASHRSLKVTWLDIPQVCVCARVSVCFYV
jgi:hypothetical protein